MTMTPTMAASATECQKTKRKMEPSLPTWLVAAVAMQMTAHQSFCPSPRRAVGCTHENGAEVELLGSDFLQAREENV